MEYGLSTSVSNPAVLRRVCGVAQGGGRVPILVKGPHKEHGHKQFFEDWIQLHLLKGMMGFWDLLNVIYTTFIRFPTSLSQEPRNQQEALELFYKDQANAYDSTRTYLLRGREDLLSRAAAYLQHGQHRQRAPGASHEDAQRPVWIDAGGGTGANIEAMTKFLDVPSYFSTIFLIDLSPSLLSIARKRFARLGWKNITMICADVHDIRFENDGTAIVTSSHHSSTTSSLSPQSEAVTKSIKLPQANLLTMSYSLSMISDPIPMLHQLPRLLSPNGIIGVVDFYVYNIVDLGSKSYVGNTRGRHVNWLSRMFWRAWFDFDRINLEPGRRDLLEYLFGTIEVDNYRNWWIGGAPYYIWIGCRKDAVVWLMDAEEEKLGVVERPQDSQSREKEVEEKLVKIVRRVRDTIADERCVSKAADEGLAGMMMESWQSGLPLPSEFYQAMFSDS